jgi:polysaccharide export outer membrane protein
MPATTFPLDIPLEEAGSNPQEGRNEVPVGVADRPMPGGGASQEASPNPENTLASPNPIIPGQRSPQSEIFGISAAYRLGIGDLINIDVFGAEDYSTQVLVLQDGTINLPRVGPVFVLGQSIQDAETTVASQYRRYIRNPMVTIAPITLRPIRIAIAGEVKRPGSYTLDRGGNNNGENNNTPLFPTLTEAIAQAGGITGKADIQEVQIRRYVAYDKTEVSTFNLWELIQSGDLRQDVVLQSGDEVFIPTSVDVSPGEVSELARASFAPDAIQVYIAGEVENPGTLEVPLDTALNEAILNAGGFNSRANRTVVDLVRVNPDGTVSQRQIEVDFSQDVNEQINPILADQDIIVVNRSGLTRFGDSVGIVLSPVTQILNTILGLDRLLFD